MKHANLTDLVSLTDWELVESKGYWIARIGQHGYIAVLPSTIAWEVAVDALLDFLDKLRTRSFPRGVHDPHEIMRFCARAARRQR